MPEKSKINKQQKKPSNVWYVKRGRMMNRKIKSVAILIFTVCTLFSCTSLSKKSRDQSPNLVKVGPGKYINRQGEEVINIPCIDSSEFSEGLATVCIIRQEFVPGIGVSKLLYINKKGVLSSTQDIPGKGEQTTLYWEDNAGKIYSAEYKVKAGSLYSNYGYIDTAGNFVIKPLFNGAKSFSEGLAVVYIKNRGYFFIDKKGTIKVGPLKGFHSISSFSEDLARFSVKNKKGDLKFGFLNKNGEIHIPAEFDYVHNFQEGFAVVRKKKEWNKETYFKYYYGVIDKNGDYVIGLDNSIVFLEKGFNNGLLPFSKGSKNFKNPEQGRGIPVIVTMKKGEAEGPDIIGTVGLFGCYDIEGDVVITPKYQYIGSFNCGVAGFEKDGKWGVIDKNEKVLCAPKYHYISTFSEGLAAFKNERNCWGYINTEGEVIIKAQYNEALPFESGRANVVDWDGNVFVINKNGDQIYPQK